MKQVTPYFLAVLISVISFGNTRLPAIIGSHMVLQQKTEVTIFSKEGLSVIPFRTDDWPVDIVMTKK